MTPLRTLGKNLRPGALFLGKDSPGVGFGAFSAKLASIFKAE